MDRRIQEKAENAVLIIESPAGEFLGSCFAFYRDGTDVYFATCAHVIGARLPADLQISRPWQVTARPDESGDDGSWRNLEIVFFGSALGAYDLAVIKASSDFAGAQSILPLAAAGRQGDDVVVVGWQAWTPGRLKIEAVPATLDKTGLLRSRDPVTSARVWTLSLEGGNRLAAGNSGGPVLDHTGHVIAVVLDRQDTRQLGTALAVSEFPRLWGGIPSSVARNLRASLPDLEELAFTRKPSRLPYQTDAYFSNQGDGFSQPDGEAGEWPDRGGFRPVQYAPGAGRLEAARSAAEIVEGLPPAVEGFAVLCFVTPFPPDV